MIIKTEHNPKPIPIRNYDWDAWDDDNKDKVAHGKTEQEAIDNLLNLIEL